MLKRRKPLPFDRLNFPIPVNWQNKALFGALNDYHQGIKAMFQDAQDVGITAEVVSVQVLPTASGWTVIAFVQQDLYAHALPTGNAYLDEVRKKERQESCTHDYDGTICIKCGHTM